MMSKMAVFVVIPTLNEADNIPELLRRLAGLRICDLNVIVVDDNSCDSTAEIAIDVAASFGCSLRVLNRPDRMGIGSAYKAGFNLALKCGADIVVQMDADLSHRPEYIPEMIVALNHHDIVIGSRYVDGAGCGKEWSLFRRLLSVTGNFLLRICLVMDIRDITSGFKCFRSTALSKVDLDHIDCKGFGFQAELAYACSKLGLSWLELPIFFDDRLKGKSKLTAMTIFEALRLAMVTALRRIFRFRSSFLLLS